MRRPHPLLASRRPGFPRGSLQSPGPAPSRGALLVALVARGCRGGVAPDGIERRVSRIEDLLGIGDAGASAPGSLAASLDAAAAVSADDRSASCAMAKVAGYEAWQDALARAKANAGPAEAACADIWSDSKKQACYRAAMAEVRATQAARDTVIAGGAPAHEAVRNVKDDPKNEAILRARTASQTVFNACDDDGGP